MTEGNDQLVERLLDLVQAGSSQVGQMKAGVDSIDNRLAKIEKAVEGNGTPGVKDRLTKVEFQQKILWAAAGVIGTVSLAAVIGAFWKLIIHA